MILVIGPMAAGKREFVSGQLGYGPEEMADGRLDDCPVIFNVQDLVFRDPAQVPALLPQLTAKAVVVINEVGAGVIPLERGSREARDACGRLSVLLAQAAAEVYRVVCGIPLRIK